jgi:hypothetical protein
MSQPATFLVFGDLHGRVLPAFRLASYWTRTYGTPLAGILQVGDLGYFPDLTRLDKATVRHAADDPLELGVQDVIRPTDLADGIFEEPTCPPGLWFTAGNHEDFDVLARLSMSHTKFNSFPVDHYCMVNAIQNGRVTELDGGLRVAAIWGVDGAESSRRTNLPDRGYITEKAIDLLLRQPFDVLLCHDAPYSAKRAGFGSKLLAMLIELSRPAFCFFGHYKGEGGPSLVSFAPTGVFHMAGFEMRGRGQTTEVGSVGVLRWADGRGEFEHLDPAFLRTFTRSNWKWR